MIESRPMLKHSIHTLLVVVFALLQCAAPLVHAHVNGQHTGLIPPALTAPHLIGNELTQTDYVIETDESPAISLANEFQRNNHPAIPQPSWSYTTDTPPVAVVKFLPVTPPSVSFFSTYSKSLPQAPPALS